LRKADAASRPVKDDPEEPILDAQLDQHGLGRVVIEPPQFALVNLRKMHSGCCDLEFARQNGRDRAEFLAKLPCQSLPVFKFDQKLPGDVRPSAERGTEACPRGGSRTCLA
jgi:hypothetical protein